MEEQARAILAGLPMAAVLVGADRRVAAANPAAEALFGRGLVGRHHSFALRQPEVLQAIALALTEARRSVVRHVLTGPSHEITHRVTVSPVDLEPERPQGRTGALAVFEDVSDQEQAEQMRRDFVANVSHELRSPLTALLGFIETLQGPAREDAAARGRFLAVMATEAGRMNRLVRDLLQLSRVEAQERQRPEERHDLAALVRGALAALRPVAEAAGVVIETEGLEAPLSLRVDPDQMAQVVTNLTENAIKYGGSGGVVRIALRREAGVRGPQVRLEVVDRGEGFDPVHIPRLAERFYRIDGHRSRAMGGTGLGLAIVKHIAHRHRGRLVVETQPGQGSCFAVILPED